jgi:hypothetical protein
MRSRSFPFAGIDVAGAARPATFRRLSGLAGDLRTHLPEMAANSSTPVWGASFADAKVGEDSPIRCASVVGVCEESLQKRGG